MYRPGAMSRCAHSCVGKVGHNHIYIQCTYGIVNLEITKYTVYTVYILHRALY